MANSPTSTPPADQQSSRADVLAAAALRRLTLQQRVGQLVMVGVPAPGPASDAWTAITRYHVGNAMLTGRSALGVAATARLSARLQARATSAATGGVGLLVATDQEGGQVQVLSGPGFAQIPTALEQGRWPVTTLRLRARDWAEQLRQAGVQVNLAPVADTVPTSHVATNEPIARYDRELGHSTERVGAHAAAITEGMRQGGVSVAAKHFPGLGLVRGNTDTTSGVTDTVTTRESAYLQPFRDAIGAGAGLVMMSSAYYARIDPNHPACFSRTLVTDVLRGDLGFSGVVISDDLGKAAQVAGWSPGRRAVLFVAAGGDVVLTVAPDDAAVMQDALYREALHSKVFRAQVDAAALRVLRLKARQGLLG